MTPARKAELEVLARRAHANAYNRGVRFNSYEKDDAILTEEILKALQHVEREVWKRVIEHYSHHVHNDLADYPDEFVDWCRTQAKETT